MTPFRVLWLALLVAVPLPFFLVATGREPVAALALMLLFTLRLIAAEGGAGAITLTAWILAAQIAAGGALLGLVAAIVTRVLDKVAGPRRSIAVFVLVALLLAIALVQPIYRTPFRAGGLHARLGEVFE